MLSDSPSNHPLKITRYVSVDDDKGQVYRLANVNIKVLLANFRKILIAESIMHRHDRFQNARGGSLTFSQEEDTALADIVADLKDASDDIHPSLLLQLLIFLNESQITRFGFLSKEKAISIRYRSPKVTKDPRTNVPLPPVTKVCDTLIVQ